MNMRNIYRKTAKKHGVTVAEVKKGMQAAIDLAYTKTDKSDREKMMQESIPRRSEVPTAGEFVESVAHKLLKEMVKAERG
ncbi:sporulation initiation factor Spo0A C-terminal domain-containing protein [Desulfitobacterium sp. PCE1]|uniref:Sporulation initiation factor Spo0A C terminal n=2 Tax=Desulfitobacterium dehalogenans TaxID=36854 RepID=I4A7V7_DESDJ|nr:sporulation initiation factor Spo0A C-terminal domain-containing protein [Desulfitobacterium sp. PCE1]AFM00042.1 Sporulation initiation factor Spo0A C terminal [Desulfitobacterium dehalogenans ATCC 51507]